MSRELNQNMDETRRSILKAAGLAVAVGAGGVTAAKAVAAGNPDYTRDPKALNGKHWAMVVDVKKFTKPEDYQKCVDACHTTHNVPNFPDEKRKIEIKWLWTDDYDHVFPGNESHYAVEWLHHKQILALCNHCEQPPCVRVCPTKATYKNTEDGIVMMDMHRCIGCRYCMAGCPYGARSFNFADPRPYIKTLNPGFPSRTKGVVEKCTFCYQRLAEGKMPACVEASEGRLIFGDLEDPKSEVRKVLRENFTIRRKPELGTFPSVYYII